MNRVWKVSASRAVELGTPVLGSWRYAGDTLLVVEEGIPYRTEVRSLTADRLSLRIHNPGEPVDITLVPADRGAP